MDLHTCSHFQFLKWVPEEWHLPLSDSSFVVYWAWKREVGSSEIQEEQVCDCEVQERYVIVRIVRFGSDMNQRDPRNVCIEEATWNGKCFCSGQAAIYILRETESGATLSVVKWRAVAVWAWRRVSSSWAPSRQGARLRRWQRHLQGQMDVASVMPALSPYGSSLGCSLETPYGI